MSFISNITDRVTAFFATGAVARTLESNPLTDPIVKYAQQKHRENLIEQLLQQTVVRNRESLDTWRTALRTAENKQRPRRQKLLQVYNRCTLDEHLTAVMHQRKLAVLSKDFKIIALKTQEENPELTKLLQTNWFYRLIEFGLDSIFYGHSLVEITTVPTTDNTAAIEAALVPREHIVPEMQQTLIKPYDETGISYIDSGFQLVEFGERHNVGLLNKAAPLIIYKANAIGAWADFINKFGQPIRIGKVSSRQQADLDQMEVFLKDMAKSPYAVIDIADDIEIKESAHSDAFKVFEEFANRLDKGVSKLILGQTMTTDDGSSHSQAAVHERVSDTYTLADCRFIAQTVNKALLPILTELGFNFANMEFVFDIPQEISAQEFAQDQWLNEYFEIPEAHFAKKYRVQITGTKTPPSAGAPLSGSASGGAGKQKGNYDDGADIITLNDMHQDLTTLYAQTCDVCGGQHHTHKYAETPNSPFADGAAEAKLLKPFLNLIKRIFKKGAADIYIGRNFMNGQIALFAKAVTAGYGKSLADVDYTTPDGKMLAFLHHNVQVFGAAKTFVEMRQLTDLLQDDSGKLREWSDFKTEALKIHTLYNSVYLKTEYDLALASAQMAAQWTRIQEAKDTNPFLKYHTIGDSRVREDHRALDGTTRRVDDKFWAQYYPPNGWNCRCDVLQLATGKETDMTKFTPPRSVTPMFKNNVGKDGVIFPETHPYYKASMEAKGDLEAIVKEQNKAMKGNERRAEIYAQPRDEQFTSVHKDQSGGEVVRHLLAQTNKADYADLLDIAKQYAEKGHRVEILPEINAQDTARAKVFTDYKGTKNPDLRIDKAYWEVKTPELPYGDTKIRNMITKAAKQSQNIFIVVNGEANGAKRYEIISSIFHSKNSQSGHLIKEVGFVMNNEKGAIYTYPNPNFGEKTKGK